MLIVLVAAFAATIPALWSAAAPSSASSPADGERGEMMLVLDSSGSMTEPASGGTTKIEAAKKSLGTVIDDLPDDAPVGLRVYGAEVEFRNQTGACTDSQRVVDIGTDNRDDLRTAVDSYRPYGETPIGYALEQAAKDLGFEGKRTIVLVSDGEPTCKPNPLQGGREPHEGRHRPAHRRRRSGRVRQGPQGTLTTTENTELSAHTYPVNYPNRESLVDQQEAASLTGK